MKGSMCFQNTSDLTIRGSIVSGVNLAFTFQHTASLATLHLSQKNRVLCIVHGETAVATRFFIPLFETLQVRIETTMTRQRLRKVEANFVVLSLQLCEELRN